ncbi:hydrolase, alpha/beta fold family, putative [Aciduliprofundum boonei T469]|nr:hydrolase, alpha/beta fold family, putative [Aciduliprofundum boonei T469]
MQEIIVDGLYGRYYPGSKGTIIMVHGLLSSMGEFHDYPEKFSNEGYAVLIIDLEGHGRSGGKRGFESVEKNIENIKRWIEYLKKNGMLKKPLILLGHSLGAATVIYALAEGIGDLGVAIAPPSSIKEELKAGERIMLPLIYQIGKLKEKLTGKDFYIKYRVDYNSLFENPENAKKAREMGYLDNKLWMGSYKPLMSLDTISKARKVNKPCLVISPEKDKVVKPENEKRVYDALGGEREFYLAKGYGHSIMIEDYGDVFAKILEFLEKQRDK